MATFVELFCFSKRLYNLQNTPVKEKVHTIKTSYKKSDHESKKVLAKPKYFTSS